MIESVFPCPVYIIKRDLNLSPTQSLRLQQEEEIEIEVAMREIDIKTLQDIIKKRGM